MYVLTITKKTIKYSILTIACVIVTALSITLICNNHKSLNKQTTGLPIKIEQVSSKNKDLPKIKVTSADEIKTVLESYGYKIKPAPQAIEQITIPAEFNDVYINYNNMQKKQGLNLEKYKGKVVKKWTFGIDNYDGTSNEVISNVLVYNNKIIAIDICSVKLDGFMHGLDKNNKLK